MYALAVKEGVDRKLARLARKDPSRLEAIRKKVVQIREDPSRFKPLRAPMEHLRRVHIGPFVLIYAVEEARKTVVLVDFEHHDRAYR